MVKTSKFYGMLTVQWERSIATMYCWPCKTTKSWWVTSIVSSRRIMHFMQNARASRSINQETSVTGSLTSQRQPSLICAQSYRILNWLDLMIDEFV